METNKQLQNAIKAHQKNKERKAIQGLKENGFKQVPEYKELFVNEFGKVYNNNTKKELKRDTKNTINANGKRVKVAKLILSAFKAEPIRENNHVIHLDGNTGNLSPDNVKYSNMFEKGRKTDVNPEKLKTAIRCYFEVSAKYNVKNYILTRMYLTEILRIRYFYSIYYDIDRIEVFKIYMQGFTNNLVSVAKTHGISVRDCRGIVNSFINLLISDILADLTAGNLIIRDFARKKTKTQVIREINEYITKNGGQPIPLRKKSNKEIVKDYKIKMEKVLNS